MLLLKQNSNTINGITFFADDEDNNQFWYMPQTIKLAEREVNGKTEAQFTLIKYTGDGKDSQGGYITFEVNMALDDGDLDSAFAEYLTGMGRKVAGTRRSPVPYDSGTVNFNVLDTSKDQGQLVSVKSPSLTADNTAIFSAKLTPQQVVVLEALFQEGAAPASVAYGLNFTGMIPALEVSVKAKFENIYTRFAGEFGVGGMIPIQTPIQFMARFNTVIENLKTSKDLEIVIKNKIPDVSTEEQEKWVMNFVKQDILQNFFSASLKNNAEGNTQAATSSSSILNSILAAAKEAASGGGGKGGETGASGVGGSLLPIPTISIDLSFVRKKETKTLDFNFISSKAIKQTVFPQNVITSKLVRGIEKKAPYYLEVNTNDPFYQQINYSIMGPDESTFDNFGLRAASFNMHYNNSSYTPDAPFTEGDKTWAKEIARSTQVDEQFKTDKDFVFKPSTETGVIGLSTATTSTTTRSVLDSLDPADYMEVQQIRMRVRGISWDDYDEIDVTINYDDGEGNKGSRDYVFAEDEAATKLFKYRKYTNKDWKISYTMTYYLADGSVKEVTNDNARPVIMIRPLDNEQTDA